MIPMANLLKKVATFALIISLAVGFAVSGFAATSPTKGNKPVDKNGVTATGTSNTYNVKKNGTAAVVSFKTKSKTATLSATMKYDGVSYRIYKIKKGAFKKSKKLRTLKIAVKKELKVEKGAFKGSKVKKIKVTKKMSKKNFKKLRKALRKAGFKGKIVRY
jgi:hypothetical protein